MIEQVKSCFAASTEAVWLTQGDEFLYANPALDRLLRRVSTKPGLGGIAHVLAPSLNQRTGMMDHYQFKTHNGSVITLEASVTQLDDNGQQYRLFIGRDVTVFVESAQALNRSLHEKEALLQEVHHRVKNNLTVIIGLLQLQSSYIEDQKAKEAFLQSQSRIRSMALIHEQLYQGKNFSRIDFSGFIKGYSRSASQFVPGSAGRGAHLELDLQTVEIDITRAVPLALVLNELLINAFQHAFNDGRPGHIFVGLHQKDDHVQLFLKDNGTGLPTDFNINNQRTLGFVLIKELVKQIAGSIVIETGSPGTLFTIKIPMGKV